MSIGDKLCEPAKSTTRETVQTDADSRYATEGYQNVLLSTKYRGCTRQLGLARVFGRNDCYPPHPGSIPTSDMLSS
jgi:hypothetical protein